MNEILIYVVPQICKDLLNQFAETFPLELYYESKTNCFRVKYVAMKMRMFDDHYFITPQGFENNPIKIDKANVISFWIPNKEVK